LNNGFFYKIALIVAGIKSKPKNLSISESNSTGREKPTSKAKPKETRVFANVDVGWGNMLHIRGECDGLSWTKGIPMKNNGNNIWTWIGKSKQCTNFQYKLLINDSIWCVGENFTANGGKDNHITPKF
jgi:hypothetical protein